jgi:L-alanine-DL-glutamate epimerase-like enolase superfamily enzyme
MSINVRNHVRPGVAAMAIAAVDVAPWDLKARILGLPLARLLVLCRDGVPVYASGGFPSYDDQQLADQLGRWIERSVPQAKMKVGRNLSAIPVV